MFGIFAKPSAAPTLDLPAVDTTIGSAAAADSKILLAHDQLSVHEAALRLRRAVLAGLKARREDVVAGYDRAHDEASELLKTL